MKTSLATDKTPYKDLKNNPETKALAKVYAEIATGRMDKYAVTQLIKQGRYALNFDAAILFSFRTTLKHLKKQKQPLTKPELRAAKLAYEIAQADLSHQIITTLFFNDKLGNNLKLLSQIKQYVTDQTDNTNSIASALNITVTNQENNTGKSKSKTQNKKQENSKTEDKDTPAVNKPLTLVAANS